MKKDHLENKISSGLCGQFEVLVTIPQLESDFDSNVANSGWCTEIHGIQ